MLFYLVIDTSVAIVLISVIAKLAFILPCTAIG